MADENGETDVARYANGRIGTTLRGKYRLDSVIGFGGMAVVYKATHRNQAEFAVKMLHPELSLREDVRSRFIREGYAANSVKHPGVVLVVDDDVAEDGAAFIVMELIDGTGCEALWERSGGRMPLDAACSIGRQLLDVLASAHAKGIVHRDLKPANLFVTREGRVKVLDFGIARVRDIAASSATMTGMLLGTPAFMGPEQALAKTSEIGAQTDVWAVGATLFTLLSGALVHEADNAQQILVKAATQKAPSLASVLPDTPKQIVDVVDRALAFDKADRWIDAATMRDALTKACEEATGHAPSMAALARLMDPTTAAPAGADLRSEAAIAQTVAADRSTKELPSPPPRSAATLPLASPAGRLMGMSTAKPVATERPPRASSNRRPAVAAAGALGLALLAVGTYGLRGGTVTKTSGLVTAPSTESDSPRVGLAPSAAPLPPLLSATTTATDVTTAPIASASTRATPARPPQPSLRPAASTTTKPSAGPSASAAPKCRNVFDHLDGDGEKVYRKQCD